MCLCGVFCFVAPNAEASCGSVYCQAVTVKVYEPSHEHAGQRMKTASARRQQPYGLLPPVETKGMDTMVAAYTSLVAARAQKMRERAQKETASRRNSSKGKQNKAATRTVQRAAQAGGGSTGTDTTAEQEAATVVAGTIWGMETRGRRKTRRGGCDADFPASAPQKKHQHPKKSPKMPSPERPRT